MSTCCRDTAHQLSQTADKLEILQARVCTILFKEKCIQPRNTFIYIYIFPFLQLRESLSGLTGFLSELGQVAGEAAKQLDQLKTL